ncbi:hypothetical protein WR25_08222 [Diploscapter pachys]|uniref:Mos1 transposase HTH domain-containing protein n=1 Tax=Diploscapter pachys TaxID=2018661 RepID=A0A2A2LHL7_9BILA|nr:hypothetical protein WR25_08222 [Diploscapter pachys]
MVIVEEILEHESVGEQAELIKKSGNEHFGKGEWKEAAEKYREALNLCPTEDASLQSLRAVLLSNLAAALLKQELWTEAAEAASKAIEENASNEKALERRAFAFFHISDKFEAAQQDYEELIWRQNSNASRTTANINNTFGEDTASRLIVNRWFYRFAAGDTSLQENERSERPSSIDNDELQSATKVNPEATTDTNAVETEPHQRKYFLFVWWNVKGSIYYELLPASRTVTAIIYVDQLQKLVDAIREKRPGRSIVHFVHDNARLHVASGTRQKTTKLGWHLVIHSSYSPGLASPDYHLFRPLKLHLREKKSTKTTTSKQQSTTS